MSKSIRDNMQGAWHLVAFFLTEAKKKDYELHIVHLVPASTTPINQTTPLLAYLVAELCWSFPSCPPRKRDTVIPAYFSWTYTHTHAQMRERETTMYTRKGKYFAQRFQRTGESSHGWNKTRDIMYIYFCTKSSTTKTNTPTNVSYLQYVVTLTNSNILKDPEISIIFTGCVVQLIAYNS